MGLSGNRAGKWGRCAPIVVAVFATAAARAAGPGFSTILSSAGQEYAGAVTSDAAGNTYVAGLTYWSGFPVTAGAVQTTFGGTCDAFVTKLGTDGKVVWSTFLGGILDDAATGIAVDPQGNVWVTGWTRSADFPVANPVQGLLNNTSSVNSSFDAFVAKIDPTGSKLLYSTFLGGADHDDAYAMAMDTAGSVYITGTTNNAAGFPGLPSSASGFGIFVTKLDSKGALVYSHFHPNGDGSGIAVDSSGAAYVTGTISSTTPIATAHAFGPAGLAEALVFKLSPDGSTVVYETTLGGGARADGYGIAVDSTGAAYVAGATSSVDFPLVKPLQNTIGARPFWKSTDAGFSFSPVDGLPFAFLVALVSEPSAPATLYGATSDVGMVKSTDGGVTWTRIDNGIASTNMAAVALDPLHPQTLFAATNPPFSGDTKHSGVVYKTVDGGNTWTAVDSVASASVLQVAVDAKNPNNVYVVWSNQGTRKSTDGGVTWNTLSFPGTYITSVYLDPGASGNLYAYSASVFYGFMSSIPSTPAFVWHSTDGGATWTKLTTSMPTPDAPMLFDPSTTPSIVYNAWRSVSLDNGATWTALPASSPVSTNATASAIGPNGALYGASTTGIYVSKDRGQTWAPIGSLNSTGAFSAVAQIVPTADSSALYTRVGNNQNSGFLTKLSPDGASIAFSTFLRGTVSFAPSTLTLAEPDVFGTQNWASFVTLDAAGNMVVGGSTRGPDFPTANPAHASNAGLADAFVSVIAADGSRFLYSTYLGGSKDDGVLALAMDPQGNIVTAGQTWSFNDFPVTTGSDPGAFSYGDAFVTKLVPPGTPVISSVLNGASYQPGIEAGSWAMIKGSGLSNTARTWTSAEVAGGNLPTALDGVSVTINGKAAYIYYISPTQINVQAPSDSTVGAVNVVVNNNGAISAPAPAQLQNAAPAFFMYPGTSQVIASSLPNFGLVGDPSTVAGAAPAKPGDTVVLWGTGFGATNPSVAAGSAVTGTPAAATPQITIGGAPTQVLNALLTAGSAGLYQITVKIPDSAAAGAAIVQASLGTLQSQNVTILIAKP